MTDKVNDWSADMVHLDTVENFSPYGKAWRGGPGGPDKL